MAQCPMRLAESYNKKVNCRISDTLLNSLMSSHIKISNKYEMMRGCDICILVKGMQNYLNVYMLTLIRKFESKKGRKAKSKAKTYKKSVHDNNEHLHEHP